MCDSCGQCSRCTKAAYSKEWSRNNRDRVAGYSNDASKFRASRKTVCAKYGITPEIFDQMLKSQDGACAICHEPETLIRRGSLCNLTIDHDHVTGKVRALLCNNCNRALGLLNDSAKILRAAADYLDQF